MLIMENHNKEFWAQQYVNRANAILENDSVFAKLIEPYIVKEYDREAKQNLPRETNSSK